eukprot:2936409-Amphidinium_carterae.1
MHIPFGLVLVRTVVTCSNALGSRGRACMRYRLHARVLTIRLARVYPRLRVLDLVAHMSGSTYGHSDPTPLA